MDSEQLTRVLVVDDELMSAQLIRRILQRESGLEVEYTTDPRRALSHFAQFQPDLVILDLLMPDLDGFAVLEQLRNHVGRDEFLPVLVITAARSPEMKARALSMGATDFLNKPYDTTEVVLRVRNLLETRALHLRLRRHGETLAARLELQEEMERRLDDERRERRTRIEGVLAGLGLMMLYQPIVDLEAAKIVGVEALARFTTGPQQVPDAWFAEAAEVGLGPELELAAIGLAIAQLAEVPPGAYLSLNVSPETVGSGLLKNVLQLVPADRLVLELTEHTHVDDYDELNEGLTELRNEGVRLAVDDAGAGFSSLRHILSLQPDIIKLDLALTRGIAEDPVRRALASSLVNFAGEIKALITAEGVETRDELEVLRSLGVGSAQGFYLSRPVTLPLAVDALTWPGND